MSNISVTVLTPNGRRQNVKVQPNKTILQILEEVCQKYNFNPSEYDLKHHKRVLDLSQSYRFSGLPNNAQIEMIEHVGKQRIDQEVVLMLQLEDGTRLSGQFQPSAVLIEILKNLCPEKVDCPNLVLIFMRTEVYGDSLATTTLKSLGLSGGKAIIRLLQKDPDSLKAQANISAPLPSRPAAKEKNDEENAKVQMKIDNSDLITFEKETADVPVIEKSEIEATEKLEESMDVDIPAGKFSPENRKKFKSNDIEVGSSSEETKNMDATSEEAKPVDSTSNQQNVEENEDLDSFILGERDTVLFSITSSTTIEQTSDDIEDSFFDLSVNDIKILYRDLRAQTEQLDDAPLLTSELREMEHNNQTLTKLGKYHKAIIRVQFPNRLILQMVFSPVETIQNIIDFIRPYIIDSVSSYYLYTTPPKQILQSDLTLVEHHCVPTALLHFGTDSVIEVDSFIKENFLEKVTTVEIGQAIARRARGLKKIVKVNNQSKPIGDKATNSKRVHGHFKPSIAPKTSTTNQHGNVPKWFKPQGK